MPRKDGSYYWVKSISDNTLRYYDSAGIDKFVYEETSEEWTWEISDSTKTLLGINQRLPDVLYNLLYLFR